MEIPRHWRLRKQRYGLKGVACQNCDEKIFPPREICPNCGGETMIDGSGTIIYNAASPFTSVDLKDSQKIPPSIT